MTENINISSSDIEKLAKLAYTKQITFVYITKIIKSNANPAIITDTQEPLGQISSRNY